MLDAIHELRSEIAETLCDPPEPHQDLSLALLEGDRSGTRQALRTRPRRPAPLPGGDKLAAIGPYSTDAPEDDFPHPGLIIHQWATYCATATRSIPPRRAWDASYRYLRSHLHYIARDNEDRLTADLGRVLELLERLCHVGRMSRAEEVADRWMRGEMAQRELRERTAEIPPAYEMTRDEAAILWPEYARQECESAPETQHKSEGFRLWERAKKRQGYAGDCSGRGRIMAHYLNIK